MTDPNPTPTADKAGVEQLAVEQIDRDAAESAVWGDADNKASNDFRDEVRSGKRDATPFVQAFARHRLAALSPASASETPAAGMGEERMREAILDALHEQLAYPTEACAIVRGVALTPDPARDEGGDHLHTDKEKG